MHSLYLNRCHILSKTKHNLPLICLRKYQCHLNFKTGEEVDWEVYNEHRCTCRLSSYSHFSGTMQKLKKYCGNGKKQFKKICWNAILPRERERRQIAYTVKPVHAVTCIKRSSFSCPVVENFIWIEPLSRGHLF